jgi:hypothetical protein
LGGVRVRADGPILPHGEFGDADCCGTLLGVIRNDRPETAEIVCNECAAVVRTVAAGDLQRALDEMEATLDLCSAICPHCNPVNLFPGFSIITAYVCKECGESVSAAGGEP